jgi:hypothetical protein
MIKSYYGNIMRLEGGVLAAEGMSFSEIHSTSDYSVFEGKFEGNSVGAYTLTRREEFSDEIAYENKCINLFAGLYDQPFVQLSYPTTYPVPKGMKFSAIFVYDDYNKDLETEPLNLKYFFCRPEALASINIPVNGREFAIKQMDTEITIPTGAILIENDLIPQSIKCVFPDIKECYQILSVIQPKNVVSSWIDETGKLTKFGENELGTLCQNGYVSEVYCIFTPDNSYVMAPNGNLRKEDGLNDDVFDEDLYTIVNVSAMVEEV